MKRTILSIILLLYGFCSKGQHAVIANDELNVAYDGIPNPITVVVEGYKPSQIMLSTDGGTLVNKGDGKYDFTPVKEGEVVLKIISLNKSKEIGKIKYRIKKIPDPIAQLDGMGSCFGGISGPKGIKVSIPYFDFDVKFIVLEYSVEILRNNKIVFSIINKSNLFSKELLTEIEKMKEEDRLLIRNIHCTGPDNKLVVTNAIVSRR